jgi:hypothetical protein
LLKYSSSIAAIQSLAHIKKARMKQNYIFLILVIIGLCSCASLGSKTLYIDENTKLAENTKIIIAEPTIINVDQSIKEVHEVLNIVISNELKKYNFQIQNSNTSLPNFTDISSKNNNSEIATLSSDFVIFTKIELFKFKNQTRDCKVEYKLVSTRTGELIFHSKFNSTFGASIVIIPVVKEYPNTDQIMLIGISSGLHQFKNRLLKR